MRRYHYVSFVLLALLLIGCDSSLIPSSSQTSNPISSTTSITSLSSTISSTDSSSSSDDSSLSSASSSSSGLESSSSDSSSSSTSSSSDDPYADWPEEPYNVVTTIDFYNINDFHGAVAYDDYAGETGINRLATYFADKKDANPEGTVITSSGDMWQGSADSNITRGHLVTDAMNLIGFDAMAIGNHEFDWGLDAIRGNIDLADFPILGANVINGATETQADFLLPYTMIQRQGVRIGIIGTIGADLEGDILTSALQGHYFDTIDSYVAAAAADLDALGADIKILINHNASASATALSYVDLAFNGHSHSYQSDLISGRPVLQAYSNGKAVAAARLSYNKITDAVSVIDYGVDNDLAYAGLAEEPVMAALYQAYYDRDIKNIKEEVVGTAEYNFSRAAIGNLTVELMYDLGQNYGARVAIHNTGGIRATIAAGDVTYGDVYKALTFDNYVVVLDVTGLQLKTWLSRSIYLEGYNGSRFTDDNTAIVNSATYKIITINYLSENIKEYPNDGLNLVNTGEYPREMVAQTWRDAGSLNPYDYD